MAFNLIKSLRFVFILLCFLIPAAWSTRLNANYYSTKMFLLYLTSAFGFLSLSFNFQIPKLPRLLLWGSVFIVAFQILFHTLSLKYDDFLQLFEFLNFLFLFLYFYSLNLNLEKVFKNTTYLILILVLFVLSVSFYEFYQLRVENESLELTLVGTFGNINMFAEFFILTLPFLFFWTRHKDKTPHLLKLLLLSSWVFFILYCRSRSAWIGFGFWLVLLAYYKISRKELASLVFAAMAYAIALYAPAKENSIAAVKDYNTVARYSLAKSSFEIIKDNPWGIRPGGFMSEIVPYQMSEEVKPSEFAYFDQPHSEIVKWPTQYGWLFAIVAYSLILSTAYIILKYLFIKKELFFVSSFFVLMPQIFFQFAYENPASVLYLSLLTALFYLNFASKETFKIHWGFRLLTGVISVVGICNALGFINSVYQESTYPRNENIVTACEYYPINFRTCHAKLGYFLDNKKNVDFLKNYKIEFLKEPFFVDYLKLLPTYYSMMGQNIKTCQSLFLYKTIFPKSEAFEKKYFDGCRGIPDVFYFQSPLQFKTQYLSWLNNLN